MLIGSPSGGKTTLLSLLNKLDHEDVDDLTPASLLYYEPPTKPGQPGRLLGILPRSDAHGLLIIKDFSPILATSNAGLRDVLFGYLRGAYDGSLNRAIATSPVRLTWSGRLTIVAACTPAIENYSIYQGELGPRSSYCRLAERTIAERRRLLNGSRSLSQDRKPAQETTNELVEHARSELPFMALTNATHDLLDDLSIISAYGRTSIARDYRHDVNGDPDTEMSFRFRNQLDILGRSCLALGLSTAEVERTCTRLALDSIPS